MEKQAHGREELRYVGNKSQLYRVQPFAYTSGKASGLRCFEADNGRLRLVIAQDRCLDLVSASYRGTNLSFLSKNGALANGYVHTDAFAFPNSFPGGMLYTCGLDDISVSERGRVTHGRVSATPAENLAWGTEERDGETVLFVQGEVKNTALFGENLTLKRRYELTAGGNELRMVDELTNEDFTEAEYVLLYHFNFGYPMIAEGARVEADILSTETVSEAADTADMLNLNAPGDGRPEEVYVHTLKKGEVRVVNEALGLACRLTYDPVRLPYLVQWKCMRSGDYALGIEPSVSRFFQKKQFQRIAAGEKLRFELSLRVEELK